MATIVEIKRELNSINKISKITNAMKIIAISKIAKAKKNYLEMVDLMTNIHESVRVLAYHLSTQQLLSNINSNRPTL
jgi:F0F1-type ATP synthase gamma subunit